MVSTPKKRMVFFDAMYTMLEARGGRARLLAKVFREEAGIVVEPEKIWQTTIEIRHSKPTSSDYRRDWEKLNGEILVALGMSEEKVNLELCKRIQRRILYDVDLYTVKPDMKELIQELFTAGIVLGVVSNQDRAAMENMMRLTDIWQHFQEKYIFTADRIGAPGETVSKPHEKFWKLVQEHVGLPPEDIVIVGNSLRNDAPAVRFGHPVILFNRSGHLKNMLPENQTGLYFVRRTKEIKARLRTLGVIP